MVCLSNDTAAFLLIRAMECRFRHSFWNSMNTDSVTPINSSSVMSCRLKEIDSRNTRCIRLFAGVSTPRLRTRLGVIDQFQRQMCRLKLRLAFPIVNRITGNVRSIDQGPFQAATSNLNHAGYSRSFCIGRAVHHRPLLQTAMPSEVRIRSMIYLSKERT